MKKSMLLILAAVLAALVCCTAAFADQDGTSQYCYQDSYGCYVLDDDANEGSPTYIWFWTEDARKAIMGDLTEPYENVLGGGKIGSSDVVKFNIPE